MKLSVIICTYNRAKYIYDLLQSLVNQTFNKSDYEIVFVNNNSNDNTDEICKNFQTENKGLNFYYFNETKQGLSHARNRGITEAKGEILIFIDDDALACKKYLEEISAFFKQNVSASAGGGKILPKYENKRPVWMSKFLEPVMSVINLGNNIKQFPPGKFPIGANMYFRKKVFEETGLFNTELGRTGKNLLGGEEKDIFNKLRKKKGLIYYLPKPWIYHIIPESRLTAAFIKKQASGIGQSEKIRALDIKKTEIYKSYLKEVFKWGASLFLFLFYVINFSPAKAKMIIMFRYWVTNGMLRIIM